MMTGRGPDSDKKMVQPLPSATSVLPRPRGTLVDGGPGTWNHQPKLHKPE